MTDTTMTVDELTAALDALVAEARARGLSDEAIVNALAHEAAVLIEGLT
jgi:hypothetical protein